MRSPRTALRSALAAICLVGAWTAAAHADGLYAQRCAACHLADGAGVPGAFPRLAGRVDGIASTSRGRSYLVMVVFKGMAGPIEVDGESIRGVMPPQAGLSDEQLAAVLNGLIALGTGKASAKSFDAAEVSAIRARGAGFDVREVARLRPDGVP